MALTAKPARQTLTDRQVQVLRFMLEFWVARQRFPVLREINDHFGFGASPNAALCHLRAIEKKGYLRLVGGAARGFELVGLSEVIRTAARAHLESLLQDNGDQPHGSLS